MIVSPRRARFGHHVRYRIAPGLVVSRLLVLRRIVEGATNFDQHEAGGVFQLLDHVEAGDSRLPHTVANVLPRRSLDSSLQGRVGSGII